MTHHRRGDQPEVVYLFNTGRVDRLGCETPDEFFYGFRSPGLSRFALRLFETDPPSQGLVDDRGNVYTVPRSIESLCRRLKGTRLTIIVRLVQLAFAGRRELRRADIVICVTSPWLHALGLLRRGRLIACPAIGVIIGPFLPPHTVRARLRNALRAWLDSGSDLVFIGEGDMTSYLANINPRPRSARLIQFGVDSRFWVPSDPTTATEAGYAFAIGNAGRDYKTLLAAWRNRTGLLRIVTTQLEPRADFGKTIEVRQGIWHSSQISDSDVRTLFQNARYVVTPLLESPQPCGQSATLQAMACGKAVILTRTSGLWDTANMRHLENCYLVDAGDVVGLADAIDYFESRPDECLRIGKAARESVERHFSSTSFANHLGALIDQTLTRKSAGTT